MKERRLPWWFKKKEEPRDIRISADHTVISAVGEGIVRLLKEEMVPDMIQGTEGIGLCKPSDHADMALGIYLYDVQEFDQMRVNGMQPADEHYQQYPPMYLSLYYMITAYSAGDIRYRSEEEQKILGKTMQVFYDHSVLDSRTLKPADQPGDQDLRIEYLNMETEEKMKIWGSVGVPYQLSLFYKVAPVELESTIRRKITRVREIQVQGEGIW